MGATSQSNLHRGTKDAIEDAFKGLVADVPYSRITVKQICDEAGVSRKTFYVHFRDKEDIVRDLFMRHVVNRFRELDAIAGFLDDREKEALKCKQLYEAVHAERDYYYALVKPIRGSDDTFLRVVTWTLYDFNIETMAKIGVRLDAVHKDYVAYFFASSQAMLLQKWISDDMPMGPSEMADMYLTLTAEFWHTLVL